MKNTMYSEVPWLHITGRGIGIWLMLSGFLPPPKAFISVMLGGVLLYIGE